MVLQNSSGVYPFFFRSVNNDFHLIDKQPALVVLLSTNMVIGSGTKGGDHFNKSTYDMDLMYQAQRFVYAQTLTKIMAIRRRKE